MIAPAGSLQTYLCLSVQVSRWKPVQCCSKGTVCLQIPTAGVSFLSVYIFNYKVYIQDVKLILHRGPHTAHFDVKPLCLPAHLIPEIY